MTTATAALVLAWIAIVLLALATAGLLRRVEQLSARTTAPAEARHEPARGLQVPMATHLAAFAGGRDDVLLLFASPSCATCQAAVDAIVAAEPAGRVGVVVREADAGPLEVPGTWVTRTSAVDLFRVLRVPATPYLVRLGPDGTIADAAIMSGGLDLEPWVARSSPVTSGN